jgi:hypothetical protein
VRRVGELGVWAQFRDNKVAAKEEHLLGKRIENAELEITAGRSQRTY